jgi:hypothetical protein
MSSILKILAILSFVISLLLGYIVATSSWATLTVQPIITTNPEVLKFFDYTDPSTPRDVLASISLWANDASYYYCAKQILESTPPSALDELKSWQTLGRVVYGLEVLLWLIPVFFVRISIGNQFKKIHTFSPIESIALGGIGCLFTFMLLALLGPATTCTGLVTGLKLKDASVNWSIVWAEIAGVLLAIGSITSILIARRNTHTTKSI